MSVKSLMSTASGVAPYPKLSGAKTGKKVKIVRSPQEGDTSMDKCSVCGMGKKDNVAHDASYSGPGKHSFKSATKSFWDIYGVSEETPICFGDAVKALGNGKIGGFGSLFSDTTNPDLTKEFFDNKTDYF